MRKADIPARLRALPWDPKEYWVIRVEGVPGVSLRGLLEMKLALGRGKDLRAAGLIREYLARAEEAQGTEAFAA